MHDLAPLTPLGAREPRVDALGPVTLTEVTSVALASVTARLGREAEARDRLARFLEAEAPAPSRLGGHAFTAFWIGVEQWMVEAPTATHQDLSTALKDVFDQCASVTEQTDAWCRFDLEGDGLSAVFERLCPVDTISWRGGEVQRSSIDHLDCFLLCRNPSHMSVLGPRSSAGSLHDALVTACRSAF